MQAVLFVELKKLLAPYAKHFAVHVDDAYGYDLEEELPYHRTMFAVLYTKPSHVRLYFYPLHIFPDLRELVPASLPIKGKWVIDIASLDAAKKKALTKLVAEAWKRIAAIRALDKTQPYCRKFSLDQTHALIAKVAKKATVELRKKDVQVTLAKPPAAIPAVLGPRVFKPGIFRFKTITPDEHAALAKLLR